MSVPTEGPWDHSLYLLRNGTAESAYAANGMLRATSVKAAMDVLQGTATAAYVAVDSLDVSVETLPATGRASGEMLGDMPNKTLRLRIPRGEQGPGVGEGIASISSERGWRALRAALATGTARAVAMGDSKTEGAGVSVIGDRWLNLLQSALRARYAPAGDQGLGYLPAFYATFYGLSPAPTTSGSAVDVGNGGGLGNRSRHLSAGGSVTWMVPAWTPGVPLLVHWTQHPGHGDLEVVTGGVVRGTIATAGSTIVSKVTSVTIPAGTTAITVRHKAGTGTGLAARVEGIVHRTATTGVIVYDGARSGAKVVDYSQGLVSDGAPNSDDYHWQSVAAVVPHAVILAFGANDQSDPPGGRTASQWADDLRTAVDKAKAAAPGAGIVVLHGAQRTEEAGDPSRILAFEAAARDAVGSDPDVSILYESRLWAPVVGEDYTDGDGSWLADTVHTNATGNAQIARYLTGSITGLDAPSDALGLVEDAIAPAVAAAQSAQADAAGARTASEVAATRAENAEAAKLEIPDANTAAMIGNPATETAQALSARFEPNRGGVVCDGYTRADVIAALDAAEVIGAYTPVFFPAGTYNVGAGLSMAGRTALIQGAGGGTDDDGGGTVFHAPMQSGPVIDFSGWVVPILGSGVSLTGRCQMGGFVAKGSGASDPTKTNDGIRFTAMSSVDFHAITIVGTGGIPLHAANSPGNAVYGCNFYGIVLNGPKDAEVNDVPYMQLIETNGCNFYGTMLRGWSAHNTCGAGGAIVCKPAVTSGATPKLIVGYMTQFYGTVVEFLEVPQDGTIFHLETNQYVINDVSWHDSGKHKDATGTSMFRIKQPTSGGLTGVASGNIIRTSLQNTDMPAWTTEQRNNEYGFFVFDCGVDIYGTGNSVEVNRPYGGHAARLRSTARNNTVRVAGSVGTASQGNPTFLNESGDVAPPFGNVLIDQSQGTFKVLHSFSVGAALLSYSAGTGTLIATTDYLRVQKASGAPGALVFPGGSGVTGGGASPYASLSASPGLLYMNAGGGHGWVKTSGAGTAGWVTFGKPTYTTAARPAASSFPPGTDIYDTTLSRTLTSDGAVWRDPMGTAV